MTSLLLAFSPFLAVALWVWGWEARDRALARSQLQASAERLGLEHARRYGEALPRSGKIVQARRLR